MMKKTWYLIIAIIGNALGTAIMNNTSLGMTAWGSSAKNISNLFGVTVGQAFIILSVFFYVVAIIIAKKFVLIKFVESFLFLFGFAFCSDFFISIIPDLSHLAYVFRLLLNVFGLLVLLFSIALHLKLQIAVHPMDVYLYELQLALRDVRKGTYLAYFSAFLIAVVAGLLHGEIEGINVGTVITLLGSGMIMHYYNVLILDKWSF